ncbi:hypothetical protein, partial [Gilliamella sp. B3976]|uniref:hypothetical protein n=1 Tax=Gilliamella sp. B3976 TaxID=2818004 RepID=UPI002269EDFC
SKPPAFDGGLREKQDVPDLTSLGFNKLELLSLLTNQRRGESLADDLKYNNYSIRNQGDYMALSR